MAATVPASPCIAAIDDILPATTSAIPSSMVSSPIIQ